MSFAHWILASLLILSIHPLLADQEAPNRPIVKSSEHGRIYAKSIPVELHGSEGETAVYAVNKEDDSLLYTFNWFSNQIYLLARPGSVVRMGPWARGHEPNEDHLAIGFYADGQKLREYSTLSIVNTSYRDKQRIGRSVSHYTVFEKILGYRWLRNDKWAFDVQTHEGLTLSFDVSTGKLRSEAEDRQDEIVRIIQDLKVEWFVANREVTRPDNYDYHLTADELKEWSDDRFPDIPKGYVLSVGPFFEEVRLERIN